MGPSFFDDIHKIQTMHTIHLFFLFLLGVSKWCNGRKTTLELSKAQKSVEDVEDGLWMNE